MAPKTHLEKRDTIPKRRIGWNDVVVQHLKFTPDEVAQDGFRDEIMSNKICNIDLGKNTFVSVIKQKDAINVILEKRTEYPLGQRRIIIDLEQWKQIMELYSEEVDNCLKKSLDGILKEEYMRHLGSNYRISISPATSYVHIRKWFLPKFSTTLRPTLTGICLDFRKWNKLKDVHVLLKNEIGDTLDNTECSISHSGQ